MNIYVGNLHYGISEDELQTLFGEYGEVTSVKIIIDKNTGKSKGFGFVVMTEEQDAKQPMEALNGLDLKGRNLKVNLAREKVETNFKKRPRNYKTINIKFRYSIFSI